jgi:nitrous oxidase accessory protein NosD
LDADLTCDSGPALVVSADHVTLDLGGHTVAGAGEAGGGPGILLRNVTGSTVRNGTVQGFGAGVVITGGSGNVVEDVAARDNIGPPAGDFGDGIVVESSRANRIARNTVAGNGPYSGIALGEGARDNEVVDNTLTDNNMAGAGPPTAGRQDMGVRIEGPGADGNRVTGNTVTGSGGDGISVLGTCVNPEDDCVGSPPNQHNEISGNTCNGNGTSGQGDGIKLFSLPNPVSPTGTTIADNVADDNATRGIAVEGGAAKGATGNRVSGNSAHGNGLFDGYDGNTGPACDANAWDGNELGSVNQPCVRSHEAAAAQPPVDPVRPPPASPARRGRTQIG